MGNEARHNIRRLLDALFETVWNLANYSIKVLNLATVDVPGVIISCRGFLVCTYCILLDAVSSDVYWVPWFDSSYRRGL